MAGLDLRGVRAVLGSWLEGSDVLVVRDNGKSDDTLDERTGRLEAAVPFLIYDGPAGVVPMNLTPSAAAPGFDTQRMPVDSETTHRLLLPLESPASILRGDLILCRSVQAAMGDPALVGRWFKVTEVPTTGTFSVLRIAFLKPDRGIDLPADWEVAP